jgi:hypothetical protein
MPTVGAQETYATWQSQDNYVERLMDNAAYSAAHPDDTLVVVGPPRLGDPTDNSFDNLQAIGMMQNFSINQARPFQPMMAIGSSRQFFLGGKAQGSAQIGRLFVNAQSLLKKLYSNYSNLGINSGNFKEKPAATDASSYFVNLDSELFLIPFGLGCVIADKSKNIIGSFYLELCVIPTYTIGVAAGQSMILESVSLLFDRVVPMNITNSANLFDTWNTTLAGGDNASSYYQKLSDTGA